DVRVDVENDLNVSWVAGDLEVTAHRDGIRLVGPRHLPPSFQQSIQELRPPQPLAAHLSLALSFRRVVRYKERATIAVTHDLKEKHLLGGLSHVVIGTGGGIERIEDHQRWAKFRYPFFQHSHDTVVVE